jgi:hypothetical protein
MSEDKEFYKVWAWIFLIVAVIFAVGSKQDDAKHKAQLEACWYDRRAC